MGCNTGKDEAEDDLFAVLVVALADFSDEGAGVAASRWSGIHFFSAAAKASLRRGLNRTSDIPTSRHLRPYSYRITIKKI